MTQRVLQTITFLVLATRLIFGATDWFCTQVASQRSGNVVSACGIGIGYTEADARHSALQAAKREFETICNQSNDCNKHKVNLIPKRNACQKLNNGRFKCYRDIEYTILRHPAEDSTVSLTEDGWEIGVTVGMGTAPVDRGASLAALDVALLRRAFSIFSVKTGITLKSGSGGPSFRRNIDTYSEDNFTGIEGYLSIPLHLSKSFSLEPKVGYSQYTYRHLTQVYNAYNITTGFTSSQYNLSQLFYGGDFIYTYRYKSIQPLGWNIILNVQKYTNITDFNGIIGVSARMGLTYEF